MKRNPFLFPSSFLLHPPPPTLRHSSTSSTFLRHRSPCHQTSSHRLHDLGIVSLFIFSPSASKQAAKPRPPRNPPHFTPQLGCRHPPKGARSLQPSQRDGFSKRAITPRGDWFNGLRAPKCERSLAFTSEWNPELYCCHRHHHIVSSSPTTRRSERPPVRHSLFTSKLSHHGCKWPWQLCCQRGPSSAQVRL